MISQQQYRRVLEAARSQDPVRGLTHDFYRYPARFSPQFVRAAIENLTEPGDTILDPFMGGGTTVVEALALGRKAVGVDINPLAAFVARVKSTPLSSLDIRIIQSWVDGFLSEINLHDPIEIDPSWDNYYKDIPWWLRKTIGLLLQSLVVLENERQSDFVRCAMLRTAQWALDLRKRKEIPSSDQFLSNLVGNIKYMINGIDSFRKMLRLNTNSYPCRIWRDRRILNSSISTLPNSRKVPESWLPPKLILTSPPYPGVHVLYHRWQVNGRRETPAPYWIANCRDGNGESFYTFGARKQKNLENYFKRMSECYKALRMIADKKTRLVQLVAFSAPEWQLPLFLETLRDCGFDEVLFDDLPETINGRSWRTVPNRKFYADHKGSTPSSKEVLLVHKLSN